MSLDNPSGVILIDKKEGITSMATDSFVKRLLGTKKVGHHGTLDPFATGLLPVYVGPSLKFVRYADDFDKKYVCVARFGISTSTLDTEGEVVGGRLPSAEELARLEATDYREVREAFAEMTKITSQIPPKFSAKKINGRKAYELARAGQAIEMKPHEVKIYAINVLDIRRVGADEGAGECVGDCAGECVGAETFEVEFEVHCSKGTYIRTICDDVGDKLGWGAHAVSLRRTMCGCFDIKDAKTEDELKAMAEAGDYSFLKDAAQTLYFLPELTLNDKQSQDVRLGRKINSKPFESVTAVYDADQKYRAMHEGKVIAVLYKSTEEDGREVMRIERMLA